MKDSIKSQYERFVTNIDVSQQLFECGFNYPCMFYWVANPKLDSLHLYRTGMDMDYLGPVEHKYPAPTAGEIKEHFPNQVWVRVNNNRSHLKRPGTFHEIKHNGKYVVSLIMKSDETDMMYEVHREEDPNEANANGLMYCYIYENNLHELHV